MSIHVPGQNRDQPNPLLVLATALDKTNNHLSEVFKAVQRIASNTAKENRHLYAMARRDESTWGTYCLACSESAEQYVYPCEVMANTDRPPSHITILPTVADHED